VIPYASRTGTLRNLAALRGAGWRLLVSATGRHNAHGFPYAVDNGAWTAHQQGKPFDVQAFELVVAELGAGADFVVAPDIVAGGLASLELSVSWLERLGGLRRVLIPVQDGMRPADLRPLISDRIGLFLGGSTEWKLETMRLWGRLARELDAYYHVGRVNSQKRIRLCQEAGAHSFDGTSATRFAVKLPVLDAAVRQGHLDLLGSSDEGKGIDD